MQDNFYTDCTFVSEFCYGKLSESIEVDVTKSVGNTLRQKGMILEWILLGELTDQEKVTLF